MCLADAASAENYDISEPLPVPIYQVTAPEPGAFQPKAGKFVLYMNRQGGTYVPGPNDARLNRSTVVPGTVTIPPWSVGQVGWDRVMTCVHDMFAAYNIEVTDQDPGDIPHIESVVAGRPQNLGLEANVAGVSPFTSDCSTIHNSIVFTFPEFLGRNYQYICEVVAQEVAHSFGLDHQILCEDPMSYLGGCGAKAFQDTDAECGEYEPRTCLCGQSSQNSVRMLTERIGLASEAPEDGLAPALDILSPTDGAVVRTGFIVELHVADNIAVSQVDLYLDGVLSQWVSAAPWAFIVAGVEPGTHTLEVRAYDTSHNVTTESIAVTVTSEPDPADQAPGRGGCAVPERGSAGSALLVLALAWLGRRPSRARRRRFFARA